MVRACDTQDSVSPLRGLRRIEGEPSTGLTPWATSVSPPSGVGVTRWPSRLRRALKLTCLGSLLTVCAACGLLAVALQNGPFQLGLPGDNTFRITSEDFVLSNYTFQQGTTHSLDFEGNGVRTMLLMHYLEETRTVELVLHQASRERTWENKLFSWQLP